METKITRVTDPSSGAHHMAGSSACVVMLYPHGPQMGKRFVLDKDETVVGRDPTCDIALDDLDNVSRRHCSILCREDDFAITDLGSKNGTFVDGVETHGVQPLRSGSTIKVGSAIFKFLFGDEVETAYHEAIYQLTIADALTQISNKRYLIEYLEREMGRALRYSRPFALLMIDLDHFKKINDENGHLAGDMVLREIAGLIKSRVRKEECFARYGGEEFALAMPEATAEGAQLVAERIRALVAETTLKFEGKTIAVTISGGVAQLTTQMTSPLDFIKAADERLYRAKKEGRNRIV